VDSLAQLALIEAWSRAHAAAVVSPFEVLLEIGVMGARTGVRSQADAMALAAAIHASPACRLVGIETYEGQGATGDSAADKAYADTLMQRVCGIALACDRARPVRQRRNPDDGGGSAIFDLVSGWLTPKLSKPVRGLLRSGCYITHDHGNYKRLVGAVNAQLHDSDGLKPAIEVWATVQSCPEPGLAILAVGRRDLSYDLELPIPLSSVNAGGACPWPRRRTGRSPPSTTSTPTCAAKGPNTRRSRSATWWRWASRTPAPPSTNGAGCRLSMNNYTVCDALVTCF
jgi:D-serine dehydratase